jgi:RsmE family RNA methyltransferase
MNIVLFDPEELASSPPAVRLPPADRRARHITGVLGLAPGDRLRAGVVNGPALWATLEAVAADGTLGIELDAPAADAPPAALHPVSLLLGHPRPIVLRRMLRDLSTLGVQRIVVARTELGEKSYLKSNLWAGETVRRLLIEGAEQAGATTLPEVETAWTLAAGIDAATAGRENAPRVVYDNAIPEAAAGAAPESAAGYGASAAAGRSRIIAVGSERGWTNAERAALAEHGFRTAALGVRILRTETAAISAVAVTLSELGLL